MLETISEAQDILVELQIFWIFPSHCLPSEEFDFARVPLRLQFLPLVQESLQGGIRRNGQAGKLGIETFADVVGAVAVVVEMVPGVNSAHPSVLEIFIQLSSFPLSS